MQHAATSRLESLRILRYHQTVQTAGCETQDHDDRERESRSVAESEIPHIGVIRINGYSFRRTSRPAAGHDLCQIKDCKSLHESENDRHKDERTKVGPFHVEKLRPFASAVDFDSLVEILRNGLQTSRKDEKYKRCRFPHVGDNDGSHCSSRLSQPSYGKIRQSETVQDSVQDADLIVKDPCPKHRNNRCGQHPWNENGYSNQIAPPS